MVICLQCHKQACFGSEGEHACYCFMHKLVGMVNVVSKRCQHIDCDKHPSFALQGCRPRYCFSHKLGGMINIKNKRRRKTAKKPHKKPHKKPYHTSVLINKTSNVTIYNNQCIYIDCCKWSSFGFTTKQARYCNIHKLNGMVDVVNEQCIELFEFISNNSVN